MKGQVPMLNDRGEDAHAAQRTLEGVGLVGVSRPGVGRDQVAQTVQMHRVATVTSNHRIGGLVSGTRLQTDRTVRVASVKMVRGLGQAPDRVGLEADNVPKNGHVGAVRHMQSVSDVQSSDRLDNGATIDSPDSESASLVSALWASGEFGPSNREVPVETSEMVLTSPDAMVPTDPLTADGVVAIAGAPVGTVWVRSE